MRKYYLFLFFFFVSLTIHSQIILSLDDDAKFIDSVEVFTKKTKSDSIKCQNSFKLSKLFLVIQNKEKSKFYLAQGNKLCLKFPYFKDASNYYNSLKFLEVGDVDGFMNNLVKTNIIIKKYNFPEAYRLRAIMYQNYCIMLQRQSNEKEAMRILVNEAIPVAKNCNDDEVLGALYKTVGIIFMNNNERKKADYYFNQAQNLVENTTRKSTSLIESKVETYTTNAENLIELKQFSKARKSLDKAFLILSKHPNSNLDSNYFYTEGIYFSKQNFQEKALQYFEKGIKISELYKNAMSLDRLKFAKYESLFKLKRFKEAKDIIKNQVETTQFIVNKKNYYRELAKTYFQLGDTDNAYLFSEKYIVLNDSLNDSKFKNEIVALEAKFNKTENEKKINQLLAQREKSELVAKNNQLNLGMLGLAVALLLLSILFLLNYYKNQKKINFQKEQNLKQEFATLQSNQKLAVSDALIKGEEIERKRLARDLHDGLGSMLSGLKIHISKLSDDNSKNSIINVGKIENQLDNSIKELRQIAQNLMPESLLKFGLENALRDLCIKMSDSEIAIEFQYYAQENEISQTKQIIIYRIVQELLNNVFKHAKATEILVSCNLNETIFYLTIEDNGKGFDTKKLSIFEGMGLKNIKNRVEFLKGKLEIDSVINEGTVFNIELNINE